MSKPDTKYLVKRGRAWSVRLRVPPVLQEKYGTHKTVALHTRSLKEAQVKRLAVASDWKRRFAVEADQVKSNPQPGTLKHVVQRGLELQAAVRYDEMSEAEAADLLDDALHEMLAHQKWETGAEDEEQIPDDVQRKLKATYKALSKTDILLSEAIELHLQHLALHAQPSTINTRRRCLGHLRAYLRDDLPVTDIDSARAAGFVESYLIPKAQSVKTKRDNLGHVYGFFEWLVTTARAPNNPFAGKAALLRSSSRASSDDSRRRDWTDSEVRFVLNSLTGIQRDLVVLLAYTGMRVEEAGQLRVEHYDSENRTLYIDGGKTKAAKRVMPIHRDLLREVVRLCRDSTDGYLLTGRNPTGPDARRAASLASTVNKKIHDKLGIAKEVVLHGFRHTLETRLMNAGVDKMVVNALLAHAQPQMMAIYYHGPTVEQLHEAIAKLHYEL